MEVGLAGWTTTLMPLQNGEGEILCPQEIKKDRIFSSLRRDGWASNLLLMVLLLILQTAARGDQCMT